MSNPMLHPGQAAACDAYALHMQQVHDFYTERYNSTSFSMPVKGTRMIIYHEDSAEAANLFSSLMHLRCDETNGIQIGSVVWVDRSRLSGEIPSPPIAHDQYTGYGQRGFIQWNEWKFLHAPTIGLEICYHIPSHSGVLVTRGVEELSIYDRATPFQSIIHWILEDAGWHMAHAAVVGFQGKGALLVGNSGSGKSTTALTCLMNPEMQFLCDDKCMLSLDPVPGAFAIYNAVKLNNDVKDRFPFFNKMIVGTDEFAKKGKNLAFLYPDLKEKTVTRLQVNSILIPRLNTQGQFGISPASPAAAFRVFGPSTSIWVPLSGPSNFRFLRSFTEKIPCFYLDLAPELQLNAERIKDHLMGFK
jgi:hypothetical protein